MKRLNVTYFHSFSKNLTDLKVFCREKDIGQTLESFCLTFDSSISVMKDLLTYIGFRKKAIDKWTNDELNTMESAESFDQKKIIVFAADERNRLIKPDDLQGWLKMWEDSCGLNQNEDASDVYRRIDDLYIEIFTNYYDLAKEFYRDSRKHKAMAGNAEVFYLRREIGGIFQMWKIKRFFTNDEKIVQKFRALRVGGRIKAYQDIVSEYGVTLYPGIDAFCQLDGHIIFTNFRIIIVRFKEKKDIAEFYFSYPYSKINYFEIGWAPFWTKNRELYLEFAGGPKLRFHFKSRWCIRYRKIVSIISGKLVKK